MLTEDHVLSLKDDIWSLGLMFIEIIIQKEAFYGTNMMKAGNCFTLKYYLKDHVKCIEAMYKDILSSL